METLVRIGQLLLSLSILVIIHECGHFFAAKIFKTRVEKFYLFFNPWFSIFKFKYKDTEYGLGWLPLGGYVKISGMIDESMDKEQMAKDPEPYEFRAKPAWQRLIIMLAGVIMNVVLAIIIYIIMLAINGEQILPNSELNYGVATNQYAEQIGFEDGDKIISIDGDTISEFSNSVAIDILLDDSKIVQIDRQGEIIDIEIPADFAKKVLDKKNKDKVLNGFFETRIFLDIDSVLEGSNAEKAGLLKTDSILNVNGGREIIFFDEFQEDLAENKGDTINLYILREDNDTSMLTILVDSSGHIGFAPKDLRADMYDYETKEYTFVEAIPAGTKMTFTTMQDYLKQLKLIFKPETKAYESVGGFIAIGKIFPAQWDWMSFWALTAFLSIILAIMNILPIPALDGGHVLILLIEVITRRTPSQKFLEVTQYIGMAILLALLIFANGNDIVGLFR